MSRYIPKVPSMHAKRPHIPSRFLSGSHMVVIDQLRRRAGAAYARLQASGNDLAAALGMHHTTITHRKAGQGGLANVLIEVHAWERRGIDTSPLDAAIAEVRAAVRQLRAGAA